MAAKNEYKKPRSVAEVQSLELLAVEIAKNIGEIRIGMISNAIESVPLTMDTAARHLAWLQTWSAKAEAEFRIFRAQQNAREQAKKWKESK